MKTTIQKAALKGATSLTAFALLCGTAYAQDTAPQSAEESSDDSGVIVVTGSILRQTDKETASPVTVLSSENLEKRGLNTAAEAIQRLSANGAGTIANGWNTGFNFASGANAPALRGLTVQNTLSIVDGQRMAPYPLADDGQRNFVDLNTIPSAIIERIEILRDGASSTYGTDAIAGVINVITKKEVQGVHANGSAGISSRGDAGEQRIDLTVGYGDLADQGFNVYVSGEYQKQDALYARQRGYPFNSSDLTGICNADGSSCMSNHNWNGVTPEDTSPAGFNGFITIPGVTLVRPITETGAFGGPYQFLNAAAGCREFNTVDVSAYSSLFPQGVCEVDTSEKYLMLQPDIERYGLSGRITVNLGDSAQFYAMANYYQTNTSQSLTPLGFNGTPTPPNGGATAYNVLLPVYVCPTGVGTANGLNTGCNATNGTLNPYNPYAAQGLRARAYLRSPFGRTVDTEAVALRGVAGVEGSFGNDWRYSVNITGSKVRLDRIQENYLIPQRIMDVVARGTFNFSDPMANSQEIWDYIAPDNVTRSTSKLWQAQGTIAKDLFQLPGGPLQVAVGAAYRYEAIDAPSANPATDGNQYDRYYGVNAVGTKGSRNVKSAFFEISAPVFDSLELSASGRYDKYSTGQESFAPKLGVKFKPIPEVLLRGTFSKGFRVPSFNEAFGLPTTGYVTRTVDCDTFVTFCAAHNNNAYAKNQYSLGLTQTGNPNLEPEKSTSFTAGVVLEPIRNVAFSVDFYHIKIKNLIVGVTDTSAAEEEYYANNGVVNIPGITVIPGVPDPDFPNALPLLGFIQSSYKNASSQSVSGIDFGINASYDLTENLSLVSQLDASYTLKYKLIDEFGTPYRYDGTLSPCNITSCSGAPKWRGSWQNTLTYKDTSLTLTAYYTKGVFTDQIDYGGTKGACASGFTYVNGDPVQCKTKDIWNVDLSINQRINDKFSIYLNVLNVFDIKPPVDVDAAYGLFQYNPAFAGPNMIGRFMRVGAKVDF